MHFSSKNSIAEKILHIVLCCDIAQLCPVPNTTKHYCNDQVMIFRLSMNRMNEWLNCSQGVLRLYGTTFYKPIHLHRKPNKIYTKEKVNQEYLPHNQTNMMNNWSQTWQTLSCLLWRYWYQDVITDDCKKIPMYRETHDVEIAAM